MGCVQSSTKDQQQSSQFKPPPPIVRHWRKQISSDDKDGLGFIVFKGLEEWKDSFEPSKKKEIVKEKTHEQILKEAEANEKKRERSRAILNRVLEIIAVKLTDKITMYLLEFACKLLECVRDAAESHDDVLAVALLNSMIALVCSFAAI